MIVLMNGDIKQLTFSDQAAFVLVLRKKRLRYADLLLPVNSRLAAQGLKTLSIEETMEIVTKNDAQVVKGVWDTLVNAVMTMAPGEKRRYSPTEDFLSVGPHSIKRKVLRRKHSIGHVSPHPF